MVSVILSTFVGVIDVMVNSVDMFIQRVFYDSAIGQYLQFAIILFSIALCLGFVKYLLNFFFKEL